MNLVNYMEDAVKLALDELLQEDANAGLRDDKTAQMDVLAYALNRLPPRYVISERGHLYTRIQELRQQFRTDIVVELTKAIQHIRANPRRS